MCGRFALNTSEAELRAHFLIKNSFVFKPKYNIAPTQIIPVVTLDSVGKPQLVFMHWGFIPTWQKTTLTEYSNARIETIEEKPTFKQAFLQKRCLIPASGFYEWQLIHQRKHPFFIYLKTQPLFAMAGIWNMAIDSGFLPTCAILTQASQKNSKIAEMNERMPVIISASKYQTWLQPRGHLAQLARCFNTESEIGFFPVSSQVNSPKFEHPACMRPLS